MSPDILYRLSVFVSSLPYLAIVAIFVHYQLKRAIWKRNRRQGKRTAGFLPSAAAMGMMFLFMQVFYRPSVENVLQERQKEDVEEDDDGDPETPAKQLNRQLRKIRRGEEIDTLVLRL
jgi:hypothetical protein